ncbi:hypothetical protein Q6241_28890, partial [Klebsiella pneumoniae]
RELLCGRQRHCGYVNKIKGYYLLECSVIERGGYIPAVEKNKPFLRADGWNDYSFVTMFYLTVFDEHGEKCDIGNVKIGFVGQKEEVSTYSLIDKKFSQLPEMFF